MAVVTTLVLSAHLDDAVLSCGGRLGPGSTVATLFAGVPPPGSLAEWDALTGAQESATRVRARHEEDRRALALLGAEGVRLDLLDAQYRVQDRATEPDPAEAVRALAALAEHATALWLPAAVGGHPDHVLTRMVGLRLARTAGTPVQLYADLPYAFLRGWPAEVTSGMCVGPAESESPWPHEAAVVREVASLRPGTLVRRVHRLGPEELKRKRAAVAAYDTQVALLEQQCGGRLRSGEDFAVEVAWELGTVGA